MISEPIRLAAVGLGRGFALSAAALKAHPGVNLIAAATRSATARAGFEADFGGRSFADLEQMLADPDIGAAIEMVYVATPHQLHKDHVIACLNAGKHAVVEKPIAVELSDASAMVRLAAEQGLKLIVGPSHSFDAPVVRAAQVIEQGQLGRPRMAHLLNWTDFLYRPRRPEELDTRQGGGVVFSQAVHQIDVAMRLLGSEPVSVYAQTGAWDPDRPTEGAYSAIITFASGAFASLCYAGYGYFDSDIWMDNIGELGVTKNAPYGQARRHLGAVADESEQKAGRAFCGLKNLPRPARHEHFGPTIISCERGELRLSPQGVVVYGKDQVETIDCPFNYARESFVQALVDALRGGPEPVQTGARGALVLATCHAILQSAARKQACPVHPSAEDYHA